MSSQATIIVEQILSSMSSDSRSGFRNSFVYRSLDNRLSKSKQIATVYHNLHTLEFAAFTARNAGNSFLKFLSVSAIAKLLRKFSMDNYHLIAEDVKQNTGNFSFDQITSLATKERLTKALLDSIIFNPKNKLIAIPLVPISVHHDYLSDQFSVVKPASFLSHIPIKFRDTSYIDPGKFPPMVDYHGKVEKPSSWLLIPAPVREIAYKKRSAILAGFALSLPSKTRYMFTLRHVFGGDCVFGESVKFRYGDSHTPGIGTDIRLDSDDHGWLDVICDLLSSEDARDQRKIKALEYFYRGWILDETERFPKHCMALDALFSSGSKSATDAIVSGVQSTLHLPNDDIRLRNLMRIRGDVIHGRAPDIYDGKNYIRYFKRFRVNPIRDLSLITERSLSVVILGDMNTTRNALEERKYIELRKRGILPQYMPSILDDK